MSENGDYNSGHFIARGHLNRQLKDCPPNLNELLSIWFSFLKYIWILRKVFFLKYLKIYFHACQFNLSLEKI